MALIALDRGRGMADVARCLADGYSTAGSPGNGLGAIMRQSDGFAVYSRPGQGTAVMARFVTRRAERGTGAIGAVVAAIPARRVCGDRWAFGAGRRDHAVRRRRSGHGPDAPQPPTAAVRIFNEHHGRGLRGCGDGMHRRWRRRAAPPWRSPGSTPGSGSCASSASATSPAAVVSDGEHAGWCRITASPGTWRRASASSPILFPGARCSSCIPTAFGTGGRSTAIPVSRLAIRADRRRAFARFPRGRDDATVVAVRAAP